MVKYTPDIGFVFGRHCVSNWGRILSDIFGMEGTVLKIAGDDLSSEWVFLVVLYSMEVLLAI